MGITPIQRLDCKCDKCGHRWITRTEKPPKVCPNCKRKDWNGDKMPDFDDTGAA